MNERIGNTIHFFVAKHIFFVVFLLFGLCSGCVSNDDNNIYIEVTENNVVLVQDRIVTIEELKDVIDTIIIDFDTEQLESLNFPITASEETSVKTIIEIRDILKEIKNEKGIENVKVNFIRN